MEKSWDKGPGGVSDVDPNQLATDKKHCEPPGNYELREIASVPSVELLEFSGEAVTCSFVPCLFERLEFMLP